MSETTARTLAEIVAEANRRHAEIESATMGTTRSMLTAELARFYAYHGPALLAVAEAADKREDPLAAAAREALDVLTRLADSAYQWAGRDVPPGLVSEIDEAKARLAGVLNG